MAALGISIKEHLAMNESLERLAKIVKPHKIERQACVELAPNGLRFSRSVSYEPVMIGGGKRGKVRGFSLASARRLRELLFKCDFRPRGKGVVGLCFTLPKEAQSQDGEDVFAVMRRHPPEELVSLVWRKEVQRNGRVHYHAVVWSSKPNPLPVAGSLLHSWCKLVAKRCSNPQNVEGRMLWAHFRGLEAFCSQDLPASTVERVCASCPALTAIDSQGQGVRYLIDHSSKHKVYQAKTTGRPWGVWARNRLPILPPGTSIYARLSDKDEVELTRILRRLSRYWVPARCVFGWHWCRGRRFARGSSIVPDAMARDAVRRWLEKRGIIPSALLPPPRPRQPVQPSLPLLGQEVCDSAAEVFEDWDKGRPVP